MSDIRDGHLFKMKHMGHGDRVGMAVTDHIVQMLEIPHATAGNNRDTHRIRDLAGDLDIKPPPRSFAINRGQQDFARAQFFAAPAPLEDIEPGAFAAVVAIGFPMIALTLGFNGQDDAL